MLYTTQRSEGMKRQRIDCLTGKRFLEEMTLKEKQDSKKTCFRGEGLSLRYARLRHQRLNLSLGGQMTEFFIYPFDWCQA